MFELDEDLTTEKEKLNSSRNELVNTVEQALAGADLLKQISEDDELFTPQEEFNSYPEKASQPSQASKASTSPAVSLEELHRRTVMEELRLAHADLVATEQDFENMGSTYERDLAEYQMAVEAGDTSLPRSEFDRVCIENGAVIARNFGKAEAAHDAALKAARRLKLLPTTWDQESGFNSDSDGYSESLVEGLQPVVESRSQELKSG
ncbi:hypothetical protein MMC13_002854 [Lambiella insularis]|nr:hypothetical protein [Lambiella insularis]